ncbi:MAG TPA: hypothetical protein VH558_16215 [Pseudolabrys sp.]|jgi:hypothetical protein
MNISEPLNTTETHHENVVQAFRNWRPPTSPEGIALRKNLARPSVLSRVFRTITFGFIAVFIALAAVVWQTGSHELEMALSAFGSQLSRFTAADHGASTVTGSTKTVAENTAASQAAPAAATSQPNEQEYNALKQQIEGVASELADLRGIAERLVANQKQLSNDLAALKASEESLKQQLLSASTRSATPAAAAKKKPPVPSRLGVAGRSSNEHSSAGAPLPLH